MPSIALLHLWHDTTPRSGALNMALDEALLNHAQEPWLRCYGWSEPSISIGFSQDYQLLAKTLPPYPVVRRWTGGGVVVHDGDWTYTLIVPRGHAFCELRPVDTYRHIHEALLAAFESSGITGSELQPVSTSEGRGICFVEPAQFDVVRGTEKLAGAAQRRSRLGFLHQGSVQHVTLPPDFGTRFAHCLAASVMHVPQAEVEALVITEAQSLAATRYATDAWLLHRRDKENGIPRAPTGGESSATA